MNCVTFLCDQVQTAALDEMFHHGETSVERYHKALLLMEGLSLIITETADLNNINKCKYDTHRLPFKSLGKEINTCIKLIISDNKDIYDITKDFYFKDGWMDR